MPFIARKGNFVCVLLTLILSGSLSTGVAFVDDESKTVPASERALLRQRLDENVGRLASVLAAAFSDVHLAGLAALFAGRRIALTSQGMAKER